MEPPRTPFGRRTSTVVIALAVLGMAALGVTREDVTAKSGMRTVVWQRQIDTAPLYNTLLKADVAEGRRGEEGNWKRPNAKSAAPTRTPLSEAQGSRDIVAVWLHVMISAVKNFVILFHSSSPLT